MQGGVVYKTVLCYHSYHVYMLYRWGVCTRCDWHWQVISIHLVWTGGVNLLPVESPWLLVREDDYVVKFLC